MKFALSVLSLALAAVATDVRFDPTYDNKGQSLNTVSCSTGQNGLVTRGFNTFGDLPTFPNIGAAQAIAGFNSAACGSCWNITFQGKSIKVTAIDHAATGFNIAEEALNTLTNGQAVQFGVINASATQLNASACGL
jgi:hypothetical protein